MGQKINPIGLRLTVNKTWDSRWFADKNYSAQLLEDLKIREYVERELKKASISKVIIERVAKKVLTSKCSIKLEPMNSFERKAIHFALSGIDHIGTHSEGVEPNRCLVIDYID